MDQFCREGACGLSPLFSVFSKTSGLAPFHHQLLYIYWLKTCFDPFWRDFFRVKRKVSFFQWYFSFFLLWDTQNKNLESLSQQSMRAIPTRHLLFLLLTELNLVWQSFDIHSKARKVRKHFANMFQGQNKKCYYFIRSTWK